MKRWLSLGMLILFPALAGAAEPRTLPTGGFAIEHELVLPGSPEEIYDAITGDLTGWWDHTFSEKPARFFLEAKPGGGFWEYFDEEGTNGVRHAVVTYADRGKLLRFEGPLGLSGNAVQMVHTYRFTAVEEDSTRLEVKVQASGVYEEGREQLVDGAWRHFLFERFQPYVLRGGHRE
jgi:hypothetical protein